jgi:hypothetical protein
LGGCPFLEMELERTELERGTLSRISFLPNSAPVAPSMSVHDDEGLPELEENPNEHPNYEPSSPAPDESQASEQPPIGSPPPVAVSKNEPWAAQPYGNLPGLPAEGLAQYVGPEVNPAKPSSANSLTPTEICFLLAEIAPCRDINLKSDCCGYTGVAVKGCGFQGAKLQYLFSRTRGGALALAITQPPVPRARSRLAGPTHGSRSCSWLVCSQGTWQTCRRPRSKSGEPTRLTSPNVAPP